MQLVPGQQVICQCKTNYMVLGTHHSARKFIDINKEIDILSDSESTSSRDVEKVKLKAAQSYLFD